MCVDPAHTTINTIHINVLLTFSLANSSMHFKYLLFLCSLLSIVAADADECSANSGKQACCNGASCLIQVIGDNCSNEAYCCNTDESFGGLINLNLENCAKLL